MTVEEMNLRAEISELEGRLRAQRNAATVASKTADLALERLQSWEPVVLAARALAAEPNRVNNMFALIAAVEALPEDIKS